jgi:hypothetical protein
MTGPPEWQLDCGLRAAGINLATRWLLGLAGALSLAPKPLTLNPFSGILNP